MPKGTAAVILMLGLALSPPMAAPATAQTQPEAAEPSPRGRAKQAREAMRVMAVFSGAAATYTDIVELTLAERMDAVRLRIATARGDLARLRPMLPDEAFGQLESRLALVEAAHEKGDRSGTALAALEGFKTIVMSADPRARRMPAEISLQSYNAFKMLVLASTHPVDWPALRLAAKDSEKAWISIRRFVRDANLRVLLSRIQAGLREAASRDDAAGVKFAASLQLASSAVLQDFIARFAQKMTRGRGDIRQMQQMMGQ